MSYRQLHIHLFLHINIKSTSELNFQLNFLSSSNGLISFSIKNNINDDQHIASKINSFKPSQVQQQKNVKRLPSNLGMLINKKTSTESIHGSQDNDFLTEMIFNQKVKSAARPLKTKVTSSNGEINI